MDYFLKLDNKDSVFFMQGDWNIAKLAHIQTELQHLSWPKQGTFTVNDQALTAFDSAGAWLFLQIIKQLSTVGVKINLQELANKHRTLLAIIEQKEVGHSSAPALRIPPWLEKVGRATSASLIELRDFLAFNGELAIEAIKVMAQPKLIRWNSITATIGTTGLAALPIIALLSFMVGVVISYQMGNQLRNYGANIFIVDLLGLSILREFGPLLTAIMVAGRTGSAFTAELGTMKINQEIDALNTMGIPSSELLILPRIIALCITLPLLTMWSDLFGVMGGMVMAHDMLGVTSYDFLQRFQYEIPVKSLLIGLCKAPVFALLISSISCFQGILVKGSADSIGKQTTRSVVLSIFFIIVADALFSILFSKFKL